LERYGEAITADLGLAGWDVVELYESGRWGFTLSLIDHLPRTSAFSQAVADDEEAAASMLDHVGERSSSTPLTEWTPEVQVLAVVANRLAEVINVLIKANGGKPGRTPTYPQPVTAIDRMRARRAKEDIDDMVSKLWPQGG
jgi:hypothetical protein